MTVTIDPVSGLEIGSSSALATLLANPLAPDAVAAAFKPMILSASGWRKVFAASGDEEDTDGRLNPADALLAGMMSYSFVKFLAGHCQKEEKKLTVTIATDSRPTGTLIADAMIRACLGLGCHVRHAFIASAPEHFAYARLEPGIDGFIYISASHNPIGHNGVKFGFNNGGVIGGDDARTLIESFRTLVADERAQEAVRSLLVGVTPARLATVFKESIEVKRASLTRYDEFSRMVAADSGEAAVQQAFVTTLSTAVKREGLGILAELNGSARTLTIDESFLKTLGAKVRVVNGVPRQVVHRIVPEGRSLDQCREELEKAWAKDKGFQLGYVPDNDGDRGNIVWLDQKSGKAHIIEAQEVFALAVLAETAHLVHSGRLQYDTAGKALQKVAIAVNDPTSMRIEDLAHIFDAKVYRAEVGEANVVNLAVNLRKKGYLVRILGEGSNGGNITHPAAVRDPLATIVSLLKLLCIKDEGNRKGLFHLYCDRAGIAYNPDFDLGDVLAALPAYTTTSAYEDRALLKIRTEDHAMLKARYEEVFKLEWELRRKDLAERLGIHSWEEINYEGTQEFRGVGKNFRTGKERGGFKILFKDASGRAVAYLWMRGSGTEPVFRVLVDVKGQRPAEEVWLLDWHTTMIAKADKA